MDTFENQGEEIKDFDVPQKVKAEHTRPGKITRHIKDHLKHHFNHIGAAALDYLNKNNFRKLDGVFIGSHKEFLRQIKEALPSRIKNKVIGEFITDYDIPVGDMTDKVKKLFL